MRSRIASGFSEGGVQFVLVSTIYQFYKNIREEKGRADITHCHDLLSVFACLPRWHSKYIYTNHSVLVDPEFHLSYYEWQHREKLALKEKAKFALITLVGRYLLRDMQTIAVSNFISVKLSKIYHVPEAHIVVIHNGVNPNDFLDKHSLKIKTECCTVLFLKPNDTRKGFHHLVEAIPRVLAENPDTRFIVAGSDAAGDYRIYIHDLLEKYNITNKVIFTGNVPFSELISLYQSATIVTMPSVYEAFGIVALEAGVSGKPVVASDVGGIGEIIIHGKTGCLVNTKDPSVFANTMLKLLQNSSLREEMGKNAKRRIQENFTWEKISGDVERVYQKVIDLKRQ